jgi:hypothetical protein
MSMHNIASSARLYARSEAMVIEILARSYARKFVFVSIALLALTLAFAFLNLATFLYLQTLWGPIWAPLAICLANLVLAGLALLAGMLTHPGPDLSLAKDLRDMAGKSLQDEVQGVSTLGTLAGGLAGGGDQGIAKLLLPVVISIISSLTRRKPAPKK